MVRLQVVLHEDEVVELHVAVAFAAGPTVVPSAAVHFTPVVEDLRAGTARAGLGDLPEVVLSQPHDPLSRNAHSLPGLDRNRVLAELERGIALVHGRPEPLRVQLHVLGDELPREVDRPVLEVVPEREIPEHLEERAVAIGTADVLEVGVLPAGTQHLLNADHTFRGRLAQAEEVRLERLHAGDDEERRGVVRRWNQRMRGHARVPALFVEALEAFA